MALTGAYWVLRSGRHSIKGTGKVLSCIPSCSDCCNSSSEPHWQISGGLRRATECWVYLCVHVSVSFIRQCRVWEVPGEKALDPQELRTQLQNTKNRTSRQAQCINSTCSGHFISGELPEAKHWLSSVFEGPKKCVSVPWRKWNPTTHARYLVLCHLHTEIIIVLSTSH